MRGYQPVSPTVPGAHFFPTNQGVVRTDGCLSKPASGYVEGQHTLSPHAENHGPGVNIRGSRCAVFLRTLLLEPGRTCLGTGHDLLRPVLIHVGSLCRRHGFKALTGDGVTVRLPSYWRDRQPGQGWFL